MDSQKPASSSTATEFGGIAPEVLLSVATAPLLVGLVVGKALSEAVRSIGLLSEEVFRGDRLPTLNFPETTDPNPDASQSS